MAAYPAYPAAPTRSRPIGVTILAVLTILGGVLLLLLGIVVVAFSSLLVGVGLPLGFGLTGSVLGAIILIFGIIWIAKMRMIAPRTLPVRPKPRGSPTPTSKDEKATTTMPRSRRRTPPRIVRTARIVTPIGRDRVGAAGYAG